MPINLTIFWFILMLLLAVIEGLTAGLVSIWFVGGALVSLVVSIFTDSIYIQFAVFLAVSFVLLVVTRPLIKNRLHKKHVSTNADMVIGKHGQVLSDILPDKTGRIKVDSTSWAARCNEPLAVGEWCLVDSIEGVTLVVSKYIKT